MSVANTFVRVAVGLVSVRNAAKTLVLVVHQPTNAPVGGMMNFAQIALRPRPVAKSTVVAMNAVICALKQTSILKAHVQLAMFARLSYVQDAVC